MNKLLKLEIINFRSFFDSQTLSFDNKINANITAIYGPNASGKSNTARALSFIKWFLQNSASAEIIKIPFEPFLLRAKNTLPSSFEIEFINGKRKFRYSFSFNMNEIVSEKLIELTSQKEKTVFNRSYQKIINITSAKKFGFTENLMNKTRNASLLITKAREDNNEYANAVFDFFTNFNIVTCGTPELRNFSVQLLKSDPILKEKVLEFLKNSDFWIRDFSIDEVNIPDDVINKLPFNDDIKGKMRAQKPISIMTKHSVRDNNGKIVDTVSLSIDNQESAGTNVIFDLSTLIINSIEKKSPLYIDEFGSHLHPDICKYILAKFRKNSNAQLILNTHDSSLMNELKREEIIFIDKKQTEESIITPLVKMSPRENDSFEKRYRKGFYGSRPFIKESL